MPRLVEVVKGSTKEKVVRVVIMSIRNLLAKGAFAAQMIDLGLPHIVQNLKAQAWTDEDLLDALNQLEIGLKDNLKKLSSFEKYKQQVLLGHLDWSPMHKDPSFWRENINNFEENDFQVCFVLYWMGNIPINILWNFSKTIGDSLCLPLFQVIP
jgi:V-type H+-transporting ATPase subunit H